MNYDYIIFGENPHGDSGLGRAAKAIHEKLLEKKVKVLFAISGNAPVWSQDFSNGDFINLFDERNVEYFIRKTLYENRDSKIFCFLENKDIINIIEETAKHIKRDYHKEIKIYSKDFVESLELPYFSKLFSDKKNEKEWYKKMPENAVVYVSYFFGSNIEIFQCLSIFAEIKAKNKNAVLIFHTNKTPEFEKVCNKLNLIISEDIIVPSTSFNDYNCSLEEIAESYNHSHFSLNPFKKGVADFYAKMSNCETCPLLLIGMEVNEYGDYIEKVEYYNSKNTQENNVEIITEEKYAEIFLKNI